MINRIFETLFFLNRFILGRVLLIYHNVDISLHTFQTLFADAYIAVYNLFYTSQPVLALACFDQDVNPKGALKVFIRTLLFYFCFVPHDFIF